MKTIKDQISAIVTFKATTLPKLSEEHCSIRARLVEGLDKMKDANIFNSAEIEEVRKWMYEILQARYSSAHADIVNKLRSDFVF